MKEKMKEEMRKEIIDELAESINRATTEFNENYIGWGVCKNIFEKKLYWFARAIVNNINGKNNIVPEKINTNIDGEMQIMEAENKRQFDDIKLRITVLEQELINKNETK